MWFWGVKSTIRLVCNYNLSVHGNLVPWSFVDLYITSSFIYSTIYSQGIISIENEDQPVILQGIYDTYDLESVESETVSGSRFVFIGEFRVFLGSCRTLFIVG